MDVAIHKPELTQFIEEQVRGGGFSSPSSVVETALLHLKEELDQDFDAETLAAIERAAQQLDAGQGRPLDDVARELRARYSR
jgi:Arc/MetJ-type ribon-helix-helix transcriptional regulator